MTEDDLEFVRIILSNPEDTYYSRPVRVRFYELAGCVRAIPSADHGARDIIPIAFVRIKAKLTPEQRVYLQLTK